MTTKKTSPPPTLKGEDGLTYILPNHWTPEIQARVYGFDEDGYPIAEYVDRESSWRQLYGMTLCCGASFKGLEDGVGCRACFSLTDGNDVPRGEIVKVQR